MTPDRLAEIYAAAFAGSRSWTASEFAGLLDSPHCFVVTEETGFALGRVIADEAELLAIATLPQDQKLGVGRRCLKAFQIEVAKRGAASAFLEVAEDNIPAIALYESAGWSHSGRRRNYYARNDGIRVDALLMASSLP